MKSEEPSAPGTEEKLARSMFDAALSPALKDLQSSKIKRLVVIPDGPLLAVPFPALVDRSGRRLLERYAISNAVSVGSLLEKAQRPVSSGSILAVGDPIPDGQQRYLAPFRAELAPLHYARVEAESVSRLYPGGVTMLGDDAREAGIKQTLAKYSILHFATHGILSETDGLQSGLLLAAESPESDEDGFLQGWEIAQMSLPARLAVLSACDTARGNLQPGEGFMGLTWAFQAAGVRNVVASLWSVDDASTQSLMVAFYRGVSRKLPMDQAMREAMSSVRRNTRYSAPFYWAAFAVYGKSGNCYSGPVSNGTHGTGVPKN